MKQFKCKPVTYQYKITKVDCDGETTINLDNAVGLPKKGVAILHNKDDKLFSENLVAVKFEDIMRKNHDPRN